MAPRRASEDHRPEEKHLQARARRVRCAGEDRERVCAQQVRSAEFRVRRLPHGQSRCSRRPGRGGAGPVVEKARPRGGRELRQALRHARPLLRALAHAHLDRPAHRPARGDGDLLPLLRLAGSINEAGDNFSAMDSASVAYIGSAIDVNELLHVACERVECFPKDEQSWKYLSTALVGVETCIGENDDAHARQYEIIFQNVSTNRAWWPERMFANPKEITFSNIALCKYKAVAACIAFPFAERCKRYVSTFQTFLTKNAKSSPKFSSVRSLLSFLKDSVEVKYERLLTPKNKKVSRKRDRVTKS